jgi:hypothetical protein
MTCERSPTFASANLANGAPGTPQTLSSGYGIRGTRAGTASMDQAAALAKADTLQQPGASCRLSEVQQ